eukprot:gb/GEZN01010522.1/.p1 GENE.gb/GEZN01010522.1/~~gb/GEZN01010522.1/.p1  ORF type:complete len:303 (-),score=32.44 gb/GEZN01010522.1/:203-1111(-)
MGGSLDCEAKMHRSEIEKDADIVSNSASLMFCKNMSKEGSMSSDCCSPQGQSDESVCYHQKRVVSPSGKGSPPPLTLSPSSRKPPAASNSPQRQAQILRARSLPRARRSNPSKPSPSSSPHQSHAVPWWKRERSRDKPVNKKETRTLAKELISAGLENLGRGIQDGTGILRRMSLEKFAAIPESDQANFFLLMGASSSEQPKLVALLSKLRLEAGAEPSSVPKIQSALPEDDLAVTNDQATTCSSSVKAPACHNVDENNEPGLATLSPSGPLNRQLPPLRRSVSGEYVLQQYHRRKRINQPY